MKHNPKYIALDFLRGLAALVVAFGHARALILQPIHETNVDLFGKVVYFFSGFGYQAVMFFFVLSGFFITKTIDNDITLDRWTLGRYWTNRLSRLWIVLIPALVLTVIFDFYGLKYFGDAPFYQGHLLHMEMINVSEHLTTTNFLGNLFYVQTLLTPTLGSNGPLWSLSYEFWYYVLIVLIFYLVHKYFSQTNKLVVLVLLAGTIVFLSIYNWEILFLFTVFLFGSGIYFYTKKNPEFRLHNGWLALFYLLFIGLLTVTRFNWIHAHYTNIPVGLFSAVTVLHFLKLDFKGMLKKVSVFLANISYTLYLVHFPFLAFLSGALGMQYLEYNYRNLTVFMLFFIASVVFSYFVYLLFERNTKWIRDRLLLFISK